MEKINISELIKNCPKGMELDCTMFEKPVKYMGLTKNETYIIAIKTSCDKIFYLTKEGYLYDTPDSKCIIFPKGKTTWEGFVPPCEFKDGDILYIRTSAIQWICIYKEGGEKENFCHRYVAATSLIFAHDDSALCHRNNIKEIRLATEEEKAKLFQAIKDNGYKWNPETKTLDKLPKFKVGDRIRLKENHNYTINITGIREEENKYECGVTFVLRFSEQDNWELVPNKFDIDTLKPLQPVLVRNTNGQVWTMDLFSHKIDTNKGLQTSFVCVGHCPNQCIPYENNEHLRGTSNNCDEYYRNWK